MAVSRYVDTLVAIVAVTHACSPASFNLEISGITSRVVTQHPRRAEKSLKRGPIQREAKDIFFAF